MNHRIWQLITGDIERNLDTGEGCTLNVRTKSGKEFSDRAWAPVGYSERVGPSDLIVLLKPDMPPIYLPLEAIECVELCA